MKFKHYNINDKINIRGIGLGVKVDKWKFQTVKGHHFTVHIINPEAHVIDDPHYYPTIQNRR